MQVQVESVGNLERRMTLHLPAERLEAQQIALFFPIDSHGKSDPAWEKTLC